MVDHPDDPPSSLNVAIERFQGFLQQNGYPQSISWLVAEDFVIDRHGHRWIRKRRDAAKLEDKIAKLYSFGLKRNEGIAFTAVCSTDSETFATIYIPADEDDAQRRLIGRCLKCSCYKDMPACSVVTNSIQWFLLRITNKGRTKQFVDNWF